MNFSLSQRKNLFLPPSKGKKKKHKTQKRVTSLPILEEFCGTTHTDIQFIRHHTTKELEFLLPSKRGETSVLTSSVWVVLPPPYSQLFLLVSFTQGVWGRGKKKAFTFQVKSASFFLFFPLIPLKKQHLLIGNSAVPTYQSV